MMYKNCLHWYYGFMGKKDFTRPKFLRPISLMSFLLKIIGKVLDNYVFENSADAVVPLPAS